MALVGSIAISMVANTAPLARGLAASATMLKSWDAAAGKHFSSGAATAKKGFKQIAESSESLGLLLKDALGNVGQVMRPVAGIAGKFGKLIGENLAQPIGLAFRTTGEVYGKMLFSPLARGAKAAAGPIVQAFKATGEVYGKALFGPLGKAAGKLNLLPIGATLMDMGKGFGVAAAGAARMAAGLGSLGLDGAKKAVVSLGSALAGLGSRLLSAAKMAGVFAAAGAAIGVALAVKAASSAAHLNETISKTEAVFGKSADGVIKDAEAMSKAFGANQQTYLDAAAALGGQLKGAGYAEQDAAALSSQLVKLGADVAAFRDIGLDEAMTKIRAGLSGEAEPLKAFGIDITDAAVKAEAARMGLVKYGEELSGSAKVQARLSVITKGLADDSGALAREVQSPANQMAEFWGRVETLGQTIGQSFAPALGGALEYVNQFLVLLTDSWEGVSTVVGEFLSGAGATLMGWAGSVAEFFEIGSGQTDAWTVALGFLANAWQAVRISFKVVVTAITAGLSGILKGLGWIGSGIDWITEKITGESLGVGAYLDRLAGKMATVAGESAQSVAEEWEKPWASMTDAPEKLGDAMTGAADRVKGAWSRAGRSVADARAELANAPRQQIGKPTDTLPEKEKKAGSSNPFAGAMKLGSAEAASAILRSRYGSQKDKDSTAANTKRSADLLARIEASQREMVRKLAARQDGSLEFMSL